MTHFDRPGHFSIVILVRILISLAAIMTPFVFVLPVAADWEPEVLLVTSPSQMPEIDAVGNYVHLVWTDYRNGNNGEIYYKRSADWGQTWGPDIRLTNDPNNSWGPDVEVSGLTVHIVYSDNRTGVEQVYYRRSGDSGLTWGAEVMLSSGPAANNSPRLKSSGKNVYVTWQSWASPGNMNVDFIRSTDDGLAWGPVRGVNLVTGKAATPDIGAWGSIVSVVWEDKRSGANQVYYQQSTDFGQTWSTTDRALTSDSNTYEGATVAIAAGSINVVFTKSTVGGSELWTCRSGDSGLTWGAAARFDGGVVGKAGNPTVARLGAGLHVAWLDLRDGGNGQIYYKSSNDAGQTWGDEVRLTTAAVPFQGYPTIGVSSRNVYVVWADQRAGPTNINLYLKKFAGPTSTASVPTFLGTVSFAATDGAFSELRALPPGSFPCAPAGYVFPFGMFAFNITELAPGEKVQITITLPGAIPANIRYFKCLGDTVIDCSAFTARLNEGTIILTLTDGGNGDSDHAANGTIVDPGGPAYPLVINTNPVPRGGSVPASQQPVSLANISIKSASVSATKVAPGMPVTVTATAVNSGNGNGSSMIKLYVNGEEESSQGIALNSGGGQQVTFTVSRNEPGTYTVQVGSVDAGSFTVDEIAETNIILFISSVLIFFVLIIGIIYILRRRQHGY